jgi:hypothetical protein
MGTAGLYIVYNYEEEAGLYIFFFYKSMGSFDKCK